MSYRTCGLAVLAAIAGSLCQAQTYNIKTIAGGSSGAGSDPALMTSLAGNDTGLAVDNSGNVYISDSGNNVIRKVTPSGAISIVAGDITAGQGGYYGDGGPAIGAGLNSPSTIALDSAGNLYISDAGNNRVRKVSKSGTITTVAGGGGSVTLGGQAVDTELLLGQGLAVDSKNNLFLVMTIGGGASAQVLKVAPNGVITNYAGDTSAFFSPGNYGDNGPATKAYIAATGLAVDSSGNLYIADGGDNRIRKVDSLGTITTVAGSNTSNYSGDGGPATSAGLNLPMQVAVDSSGNLYIADRNDYRIRKVSGGIITTIAGTGRPGNSGDGGPAASATVNTVQSIAVGMGGDVYFADVRVEDGAGLIRELTPVVLSPSIAPNGIVSLFSSSTTIQPGAWASVFGNNLATGTAVWAGNFPISLNGTSVTVDGRNAFLSYVSPGQVNFQVPDDDNTGVVTVAVKTPGGTATSPVTLADFAPSFSLLDAEHVAGIILRSDGSGAYGGGTYDIIGPTGTSLGYKTVAAKAGDAIELFGVGFGPTNPTVTAGKPYSGAAATTNAVQLLINNKPVTPDFSGITAAGLYQFNIDSLPAGLGSGDVSLKATVGGADTQPSVVISLQ